MEDEMGEAAASWMDDADDLVEDAVQVSRRLPPAVLSALGRLAEALRAARPDAIGTNGRS